MLCMHPVPELPLASSSLHSSSPSPSVTLKQQPLPSLALPSHVTQGPISYSSDISSLKSSQSASQRHDGPSRGTSQYGAVPDHPGSNAHEEVTINIPPAHAISELSMSAGVRSPSPSRAPLPESFMDLEARPLPRSSSTQRMRRPLSRRITEVDEDDADGSSEEEETQGPLAVVENDPFKHPKRFSLRRELTPDAVEHTPERNGKQQERRPCMSFLGSTQFIQDLAQGPNLHGSE
ncbi:hypothetical protein BDR06DRAFT_1015179 [Suillus hirtellus]|nr:hypothetical protein BDR06DRAFT_1015179 [Suillus hirtellus]